MKSSPSPVGRPVRGRAAAAVLILATLAACGGGGNELGPADDLLATPSAVLVGDTTHCASGVGPTIFVYGGLPPYTLKNSAPTAMTLDVTRLEKAGQGFTLSFSGQCIRSMPITIEDDMGRVLEVPITNGAA